MRKRTQTLLGSNLLAILFTDTLYKGRFVLKVSNNPFYLFFGGIRLNI